MPALSGAVLHTCYGRRHSTLAETRILAYDNIGCKRHCGLTAQPYGPLPVRLRYGVAANPIHQYIPIWQAQGSPKYSHIEIAAFEPMTDKIVRGSRLWRAKKSFAAASRSAIVVNSSQWVTSRRKWRQSISIGLSQGL